MAFTATLSFGGKEFDILDRSYSLKRDKDSKGRPSSGIYGGDVTIHIESTDDTSILEAMATQYKPVSGSITFKNGDEESKRKELIFENGYIIAFEESIDVVGFKPMSLTFIVSAQILKTGGAQIEQNWPGN
ncbi:MAG: type VI secretion system needle protein Hcp [Tannerellaceae bacterium]|nr:type VI secretion system needle protein Hcp [Tannerellaceae bacterium]